MMATGPDASAVPDVVAPELFRRKAEPRPLGDLAEEMVKAFGAGPSLPAAALFHGVNRGRTVAGFAFYVALGFILYRVISATITAIAAFSTAVFSWAGVALICEEAAINLGLIIGLTTTLVALLGAQANEMMALRGEAVDMTMFPRRGWPLSAAGKYSDATVKDGDADWSLRQA